MQIMSLCEMDLLLTAGSAEPLTFERSQIEQMYFTALLDLISVNLRAWSHSISSSGREQFLGTLMTIPVSFQLTA